MASDSTPIAPSMQPADGDAHLLDLPQALLTDLLSSKYCSGSTSRSAATACRGLRLAALEGITLCHADLDLATAAEVFAFARSLPVLHHMRLTGLDTDPKDTELRALAALAARLHGLDIEGPDITRTSDSNWAALAALTSLRCLRLASCGVGDGSAHILPALSNLHTLNLERNRITGAGACALAAACPSLRALDLSHNAVHDEGACALASLTALAHLRVHCCRIGSEGAAALSTLTTLTLLDLGLNTILDTHSVALLTNLRSLDLQGCGVTAGDAAALATLSNLTHLEISRNTELRDMGARSLASLTGLSSLAIGSCSLEESGSAALAALTRLTHLNLSHCENSRLERRQWALLNRLQRLELDGCSFQHRPILAALSALEHLSIRSVHLGTQAAMSICALTSLTFLDTTDTFIRWFLFDEDEIDDIVHALPGFTGLRQLQMSTVLGACENAIASLTTLTLLQMSYYTGWEQGLLQALVGLTRLQSLWLCCICQPGHRLKLLHTLTGLTCLSLDRAGIGNKGAIAVARLPQLRQLQLARCDVGDEGARALARLTALRCLQLQQNQLGPASATALTALIKLTLLSLARNQLIGGASAYRALSGLTRLRHLDLAACGLGPAGALLLTRLTRLTCLNLSEHEVPLGQVALDRLRLS